MKKYLLSFILAIIVGFFMLEFFINQYDDYNGIKVSKSGETLYFIQYGAFSNVDSMEKNTISLENYVYNNDNNLYYVYIGITKDKIVANKIIEYYKNIGYDTILKEYLVTNEKFLNEVKNYDELFLSTEDIVVKKSLINQVLTKYEEVVINGGKN